MPEYKCEYKLSDDCRYATLTYRFRNVDEATAFETFVRTSFEQFRKLHEAAMKTESWPDDEKIWD